MLDLGHKGQRAPEPTYKSFSNNMHLRYRNIGLPSSLRTHTGESWGFGTSRPGDIALLFIWIGQS